MAARFYNPAGIDVEVRQAMMRGREGRGAAGRVEERGHTRPPLFPGLLTATMHHHMSAGPAPPPPLHCRTSK